VIYVLSVSVIRPLPGFYQMSEGLRLGGVEREWRDFDEFGPQVARSAVAAEDANFCMHNGVDWDALNLVIESALEGEGTRGASTISMQTSKNLFLWSSRSYIRKGLEIPMALFSDYVWDKKRTMEIYLNIAQWGHGIFGIEAASDIYFGKSAKDLTPRQAALLAVSLPNPLLRNPAKPSSGLNRLAQNVQKRAQQSGAYIKCLYP